MNKTYNLPCYRVELVRDRTVKIESETINSPQDVSKLALTFADKDREYLVCVWLGVRRQIIGHEIVSIGILTASLAHPREIFKGAVIAGAHAIILFHNHPSGYMSPSKEDLSLTERISQAGRVMGIPLLDHLIVSTSGYISLKATGQCQFYDGAKERRNNE